MKQRGDKVMMGIPVDDSIACRDHGEEHDNDHLLPMAATRHRRLKKKMTKKIIAILVGLMVLIFICSVVTVPAGHVGVIDFFGSVSDSALSPGLHMVNPLSRVERMSVQTQIVTMSEDVPTQEGMNVHLEAAALIHLKKEEATHMYRTVGADYLDRVVVPQFRSVLRSITSEHEAKDLYTGTARLAMSKNLLGMLQTILDTRGLVVEETPLKKLELPETLHHAIEDKLSAEQQSQKMQFVLAKERQEAERKVIEAEGIANYQKIVSQDISESLLRWKGIEATERLASSPNAKLVVAGGADGLPIIFNPSSSM